MAGSGRLPAASGGFAGSAVSRGEIHGRSRRWRFASSAPWLIPTAIACAFVIGYAVANLPGYANGSDTVVLVHGARAIAACFSHGIHSYCDRYGRWLEDGRGTFSVNGIPENNVGPYPLFQYLPALVLTQLGFSDHHTYTGLTLISLLSFCAVVALGTWTASCTGRRWAPALVALILVTSPLMYYAGSTLGESLATLLVALLAVACLRRWPPAVLALCALLACLTKETVFPIVALLGGAALWATPIATRPLRRAHWAGLALGLLLGVGVTAAFDWFRYHQLTNYAYLHSYESVPGITRRLRLAVALWIAPNGGLTEFWPLATVVAIGAVWVVVAHLRARPIPLNRALPGLIVILSLLIVTGTLASWWAPFGWISWGPRLTLPTVPAVLFIVIAIYGGELERLLRTLLGTPARIAAISVIVIAIALAQVNVLNAQAAVTKLFAPDRTCPGLPSVLQTAHYYHCIDHWAWGRHWTLLDTFKALGHPWGAVFEAAFVAIWIALILAVARGSKDPVWNSAPDARMSWRRRATSR